MVKRFEGEGPNQRIFFSPLFLPCRVFGRKILGFSGWRGGENLGFQESHGRKKNTSATEAAEKFWPFFLVQNQDFSGEMTNFGAFWNFTVVRFATLSVLTDVSFGENEISTDVRFRAFLGGKTGQGEKRKKKLAPK